MTEVESRNDFNSTIHRIENLCLERWYFCLKLKTIFGFHLLSVFLFLSIRPAKNDDNEERREEGEKKRAMVLKEGEIERAKEKEGDGEREKEREREREREREKMKRRIRGNICSDIALQLY